MVCVEHQIEAEYWAHWDLFPHVRQVTPALVSELRDCLTHGMVGESFILHTHVLVLDARIED